MASIKTLEQAPGLMSSLISRLSPGIVIATVACLASYLIEVNKPPILTRSEAFPLHHWQQFVLPILPSPVKVSRPEAMGCYSCPICILSPKRQTPSDSEGLA
jgi:hypothetical protein